MVTVQSSLSQLTDSIVYLGTNCNHFSYPTEFQTYDEAWESLFASLSNLRLKLGELRYAQLVEMGTQAKSHYRDAYDMNPSRVRLSSDTPGLNELKLGSWLLQDMGQVIKGKPPFAYPPELYRWRSDTAEQVH